MCTMFGSLDQRVYHRPLEKHSHETGRDGPQELQQNTSISRGFVLGAPVPAMLLATWWVRTPSMTGAQSDHRGKTVFTLLTGDHALPHFTHLPSSCGHVIKSEFFRSLTFHCLFRRADHLSMPRAVLVQLVFQRLACWSSARPTPGVPCAWSHHGHVACDGGFGLRR